jgi:hypothetical protein
MYTPHMFIFWREFGLISVPALFMFGMHLAEIGPS